MKIARRGFTQGFELVIAVLAIAAAISFVLNPDALAESPIGRTFHPIDWIWNTGYGVSGVFIVVGVLSGRAHIEGAGLCVLASAVGLSAIAYFYVLHFDGTIPSYVSFLAVILASLGRLYELLRYPEVVVVRKEPL